MRKSMTLAILAAASLGMAQPESNTVRKQMEQLFTMLSAKIAKGDAASLWGHFDPNYVNVDLNGNRSNLAQFKESMGGLMKNSRDVKIKFNIKNVQLQNREAVVWNEEVLTWLEKSATGRWVAMKSTSRWAETLAWKDGGWKLTFSQQLMTNEPWSFRTNG